jgi:hypothetical protein
MGDERNVPKPDTHYSGRPHRELKEWTDAGQPGDAQDFGSVWRGMGDGLKEAAESLMVAVFGSESGWTGQAANAMRAQLTKVAEWSQKTGDGYQKASQAFEQQGEAVGTAKTAMPEPVDYDPGKMIKDAATSGNPLKLAMLPFQMHKQAEASKEAHAQAAEVVAKRDEELALAAHSIPPFEAPPALNEEGGKKPGPDGPEVPGGSRVPGGSTVNGPGNVPGPGHVGGPGHAGGPGGPGTPGGPNGGAAGNGPGSDDQNQTPPNISVPSLPIGSGTGTSGYAPTPPPNAFQATTGPGGGGPVAAGGGGGFGNSFGGGFGPGATSGARPPAGFGPTGQGAGAGAGPGSLGGAGKAGAGGKGAGGMGSGGAGHKGEGGEDGEHQRPAYLVEPDPDAMFGTDQMTAPPVIGG